MTEDDDIEVVATTCTNIAETLQDCGYVALQPYIPQLAEAILSLLRKNLVCQQVDSGSDMDETDVDHDELLMNAVADLLPAFAKAMGPHFKPIFVGLFDPLMKFVKVLHPPKDQTMVVACLADVAQEMGAPISGYVDRCSCCMPLVLKELSSSNSTNRRNAAFCGGEICKNGGAATLKYYGDIIHLLYPLFRDSKLDFGVRDSSAGAVARMVMVQPHTVPLNQVLPVFLKALPLKKIFKNP